MVTSRMPMHRPISQPPPAPTCLAQKAVGPAYRLLLCCMLFAQGCLAQAPQSLDPNEQGTPGGANGTGGAEDDGTDAVAAGSSLRRLTNVQYTNSVTEIFGNTVVVPPLSVTDLAIDGLTGAGTSEVGMPVTDAEGYLAAAVDISLQVASTDYRAQLPCVPTGTADTACAEAVIDRYGPRLMHRPMSSAQRQRYVALLLGEAKAGNSFYRGVSAATTAMLLSPSFLFRSDVTQTGTNADATAFDAYTLADRLAYLLWNQAPDAALWGAAKDGSLLQRKIYEAQVQRLLSDPRSDTALFGFVRELLQLDNILTAQKDPNAYPQSLAQDLHTQAVMTIKDLLLTQNADYRELFVSQNFFVNADLAKRYNFPAAAGNDFTKVRITADDRAGLFGLPGITTMLSPSARTSPTKRGIYIRGSLMCTTIPSPPANVDTAVTSDSKNPKTMRDIMTSHGSNPACSSCHNLMDPPGFALDGFDWLGRYRATDQNLPLDLSGTLDGRSFVNARTFGQALHDDDAVTQCFVRKFIAHATSHAPLAAAQETSTLHDAFAARNFSVRELARALVLSDAFTHAQTN